MRVSIESIGAVGPGFANWAQLRAVLRAEQAYAPAPTDVPKVQSLPPAERRRVGVAVRIALATAHQAFEASTFEPADVQTVFATSSGDGQNCHILCEALAEPERLISPTKFTNSVHNAAAGYWGIATGAMAASTSLCAYDGSFAAGMFEAAVLALTDSKPVALIAYDAPYPDPLSAKRPMLDAMAVTLVLAPPAGGDALGSLDVQHPSAVTPGADKPTGLQDPALETVRTGIPAGRCLTLLRALACQQADSIVIEAGDGQQIRVQVAK